MKEGITGAHFWKVVNRWKMYSFLMATNNNASTLFQNRQKRSLLCMYTRNRLPTMVMYTAKLSTKPETNHPSRGHPISATWELSGQHCGFEHWEPSGELTKKCFNFPNEKIDIIIDIITNSYDTVNIRIFLPQMKRKIFQVGCSKKSVN